MTFLRNFDWLLLLAMLLLIALGVTMIASTALGELQNYDLAIRQAVFALIGLILFFAFFRVDPELWQPLSYAIYIVSVAALIVTFVYGLEVRGSLRWIDIGVFRFQPSEIVKLATILTLANFLTTHQMRKLRNVLISAGIALLPTGLIFLQPDLGSAVVLTLIWVGMILTTDIARKYILIGIGLVVTAVPLAYEFLQPYQRERLLTFLNPGADPLGAGYNVIQSTIAVGSGGIFGLGFGRGTQSHLNFLPEHHTDFIFATLAEELGLVGTLMLFTLLGILIWRLLKNLSYVSRFGGFVLMGLFVLIATQAAINIGMNIGLAPVTGITLPFVSYGGSSLITLMIGLGIAEAIIVRRTRGEIVDEGE